MNIYDFCDTLDLQIALIRYPNQDGRWSAWFSKIERHLSIVEAVDSCVCVGAYGNGKTPDEAMSNLIERTRGYWLLIDEGQPTRRLQPIPKTLVVGNCD